MRGLPLLVTLLVLVLMLYVAPATALEVDIILSNGNAKVCIVGTADITGKPLVSLKYRLLYSDYIMYRGELASLLEQGLEKYLEGLLGRDVKVSVDQLDLRVEEVYRNETSYPANITAVVGQLEQIDSTYRVVAASTLAGQAVEVEIEFDNVEVFGSAKLVIAAALSMPVEHAELWVYNYSAEAWDVYPISEINSTAKTYVEKVFTLAEMLDYTSNGKMVVRLWLDTSDTATPLELYLYAVYLTSPTIQQSLYREKLCFTIEGVGEVRELGLARYDMRIRYMSPSMVLSSQNIGGVDMNLLLLNLTAFKVPLSEWASEFNGTHTIFKLHVPAIVYEYCGEKFVVDPIERIVVEGYARAEGDEVVVVPPIIVGAGAMLAIAVLTAALLAVGKALKKQKQVIAEKGRRFVGRKKR